MVWAVPNVVLRTEIVRGLEIEAVSLARGVTIERP
jgi:hypothetical protein